MSLSDCRIAAVAAVSDLDRAKEFFEGSLGLSPKGSGAAGDEIVFDCGDSTDLMVYVSPANAGGGSATLACWSVNDLDAEMESLRGKGIEFEIYDGLGQDENGVLEMDGGRAAWFTDPDGNTFAVAEN